MPDLVRRIGVTAIGMIACSWPHTRDRSTTLSACEGPAASLLRPATAIAEAATQIAAIWPGFWPRPTFGYYLADSATVMVADEASNSFRRLECASTINGLATRAWILDGPNKQYQAGITPIMRGNSAAGALVRLRATDSASVDLVVHESFHLYQVTRFSAFFSPPLVRALPDTLALGTAFGPELALELNLLADALVALPERRRGIARAYLARRSVRLADRPWVASAERKMEMVEGTAQYVGLRAAELATAPPARGTTLSRGVAAALREIASRIKLDASTVRDLAPRSYESGSAIALLLDEYHAGWKSAVEQGMPLDSLLAQALAK